MRKLKKKIYEYTAVFEKHDKDYVVTVPSLPGVVTEGKNLAEATYMVKDAIKCYLEAILLEKVLNPRPKRTVHRRVKISPPRLSYA